MAKERIKRQREEKVNKKKRRKGGDVEKRK